MRLQSLSKRAQLFVWGALGAAYAAVVLLVGVPCVFHSLTGLYCSGCGGTRATLALLEGDLPLAVRQNPWIVIVVFPWLVLLAGSMALPRSVRLARAARFSTRFAAYTAVAFLVVRNVPLPSFEWMRPLPAQNSRRANVIATATTVEGLPTSILPNRLERIQAG